MEASQLGQDQGAISFRISRNTSLRKYTIDQGADTGSSVCHADIHYWHHSKPSVELRAGSGKRSPIVAFARIASSVREATLALGDPDHDSPNSIVYEPLKERSAYTLLHYEFKTDEGADGDRRTYTWTRFSQLSQDIECKDISTNQIVANFKSKGQLRSKPMGEMKVASSTSPRFRHLLFLSFIVMKDIEVRIGAAAGVGV